MAGNTARVFEDFPAVRSRVPLLIGLVGPSGSGKTKSALRLADGVQRVYGGDIYGVDSEANRMLHYADDHRFRHVPFRAPFDALSYLAAVEHCVRRGARTVIIDSASHLHEGPGGTLEMHESECDRLMTAWKQPRDKVQMAAWQKPKAELRRFLNTVLQMDVNTIWCFRAKEKVKIIPGKPPQSLGFMPIAGDEMIYEMTLNCLLYPSSGGVPSWHPEEMGEKAIVKLPEQFTKIFADSRPLSEDIGEALAKWAVGTSSPKQATPAIEVPPTVDDYTTCATQSDFDALEKRRMELWRKVQTDAKPKLKAASEAAQARLQRPAFDPSKASEMLNAANTEAEAVAAWDVIVRGYEDLGREIPLDLVTLFNDRKAELSRL